MQPPFIPENAPFSKEQISYLNGFLASMYSNQGGAIGGMPSGAPAKPITLLWGSQTGNSEGLAKQIGKRLKASGFAPAIIDMGAYDPSKLGQEDLLLIVTSTYGEGEPPDNAAVLHEWIQKEGAPKLEKLRYSVLSLGDTSYADFCKCGIEFDERLAALGAKRIAPRVDCDKDYEAPFARWLDSVFSSLGEVASAPAPEESGPKNEYGKKNPFPAKLLVNRNLNGAGSIKETRHIEISLKGSGLTYEAGDALAVKPVNNARLVDELIRAAGFAPSELAPVPHGDDQPLFDALRHHYDITSLTTAFVMACARLSKSPVLKDLVADPEKLSAYLSGRQMIDPILEFNVVFPTTEYLVAPLKQLQPRLYSISSSPNAHPDEVHVTVGAVSYEAHGRKRKGVCSMYLAEHDGAQAVEVYFHPSKTFKLPENNELPVIMVGPGTGIAPFRSFLEERKARGAAGKNWLFFGDQKAECDFLYREEIEAYFREGFLTRFDTAFSRDQKEKIYVQTRMIEHGPELFQWLEEGGCFYVCGDASRMAKDVDAALHAVIETHGKLSAEEAVDYVKKMKAEKRYLRDVY